jgi:hypothetical protein
VAVTLEGLPSKQAMSFEEAAMRIDVLVVPDCPNGPVVIERLAQALAGRADVQVETRVIDTVEQAEQWGMHGSPTVLVDGRDPFAAPGTPASLSCRLYQGDGEGGRAQGAPSLARLRQALDGQEERRARESAAGAPAGRAGRGRLAQVAGGWRAVHQAVLRGFAQTGTAPGAEALEAAAAPSGVAAGQVLAELAAEDFLTLDAGGRISAAYPFSAAPTGVQVELPGGVTVSAMCAIDALGIPAMLGLDALITSTDPVTGAPIRVRFTDGAAAWEPGSAAVFYGARPEAGPSASVCCGYLRFFASRESAGQFAAGHPEAEGTILDQQAAQRLGEEIFGPLLRTAG